MILLGLLSEIAWPGAAADREVLEKPGAHAERAPRPS